MNCQQAKELLIAYRSGVEESLDEQTAAALDLAKRDPELAKWFQTQQTFHAVTRQAFQNMPVPVGLKDRILQHRPSPKPKVFWLNRFEFLAAAAAVILLLSLAVFWMQPTDERRFADYRARMTKFALRDYRMDLVTNDLSQIRSYLAHRGVPADYDLNPRLQSMEGVGCAALKWQNQPVSLICFRLGQEDLLWLFVTPQATLQDPPNSPNPQFQPVGKLMTAAWTEQGKTYLLAVIGDQNLLRKFL